MGWIHVYPKEGEGYLAFLPDPLPPRLEMSRGMLESLHDAELAIESLGKSAVEAGIYSDLFICREAVFSSRIEHIYASLPDLCFYRAMSLSDAIEVPINVRRVMGYVDALRYGIDRLNTLPIGLRFMRELHQQLMCNAEDARSYPGEFRRTQNWIGPPGSTPQNAVFVPPPVEQMYNALYDLETYLNKTRCVYPPVVRLAIAHYQFEAIHPFVDGNGRIGRMLIPLLLVAWGVLPFPVLCMSAYFCRLRKRYHDLLLGVSKQDRWKEWIIFFLRGVSEQATDAATRIEKLGGLRQRWLDKLRIGERDKERAIIDLLFAEPITTIQRVGQVTALSPDVVGRMIGELTRAEILHPLQENSGVYCATGVIQIVGEGA